MSNEASQRQKEEQDRLDQLAKDRKAEKILEIERKRETDNLSKKDDEDGPTWFKKKN